MKKGKLIVLIFLVFLVSFMTIGVLALQPSGATVTPGTSNRAPEDGAGNDPNALAGNITEVTIFGYTNTQSWQGYYGNVSGTIQLADIDDNAMYNWSLATPEGEVYASNSSSLNWTAIACFDIATNGQIFEGMFGIDQYDIDGINETFAVTTHPLFYTNNVEFSSGECNGTQLFGPGGTALYEEVLMYDGTHIVFTSIIKEGAILGFDGKDHDFEMIVLEDGHLTDVAVRPYYFWVELE